MIPRFAPLTLASSLLVAALAAACGGSAPPPETPPVPTAEPVAVAPPPTPSATPTAAPTAAPTAPPSGPAGTPVTPSKLLADIKKIGIDPAKNPVLEKMALGDKKKLMPFFQKALGYKDCTGCHATLSDYKTVTHNMQLARGMWDHFVAYGRDVDGGVLFCDSCHAASPKVLNHADRAGVKKFMETDYVGKIKRADKKEMECTTCHGDAMELDIFGKVWNVK